MTNRASGIGGKSHFTVMAGTAVLAFIQRLHGEIFIVFGCSGFHFKEAVVATIALQTLREMIFVLKDNRFNRLGKNYRATTFVVSSSEGLTREGQYQESHGQQDP